MRKVLAAVIGLILGTTGVASAFPELALADSVEMTVRSDIGWQPTTLDLSAGQTFTVEYRSGTWTVDYRAFARVGIGGYDAAYDQRIYQGCKILTDQTYGHLLARTGSGAPFLADHDGTFTAPAAGRLEFRINDDDRCLGDNAGAVDLLVSTDTAGPGPTTDPTTTPTMNPDSGATMFTASWASGLNGWAGDAPWKTLRGVLLNDGTGNSYIRAPFTSAVPDYAVEVSIRVISGGRFGLYFRNSDTERGYVGVIDAGGGGTQLRDDDDACCMGPMTGGPSFDPGKDWHTYRVEADGNVIRLLIDGAQFVTTTDNKYLTGGRTGIYANGAQLEISAFKVMHLH